MLTIDCAKYVKAAARKQSDIASYSLEGHIFAKLVKRA